ncbi:hypothetical protein M3Y97_00800600 [Aphelenchoides bicaudatus]|nr:hypothetical protein M3Y97_00800600 [Aphelenchoides bicaudatus]
MSRNDLDLNDQIEEVRELLYDIVKKSKCGVDSVLLSQEYDRQFVQTGIARPLPAAWLRYVKAADEFEVKQEDGQTTISVVQQGQIQIPILKDLNISSEPASVVEEKPLVIPELIDLKPLGLSSMPTTKSKVHVLSVTDPENIMFRLNSWDPMPDYLYSALAKDFNEANKNASRVLPSDGLICVAKLPNGSWERVKLVKPSSLKKGFYVVYAVDVGIYHLTHEKNLQPISASLQAFKNFLIAKCKLAKIKPANNNKLWSREAQQALSDWLSDAQDTEIEMVPSGAWKFTDGPTTVPFIEAELFINGENLANKLINLGFAEPLN